MGRFVGRLRRLVARLPQGGAEVYKRRLETFVGLPVKGNEGAWFELLTELQLADYLLAIDTHLPAVVNGCEWREKKMPSLWVHKEVVRRFDRDLALHSNRMVEVKRGRLDYFIRPVGKVVEIPFGEINPEHPESAADIEALHPSAVARRRDISASRDWGEYYDRQGSFLTEQEIAHALSLLDGIFNDKEVAEVVVVRAIGVTRERYLDEASTPAECKRRQAAWKRAERHKVCEKHGALHMALRDAARKRDDGLPPTDRGASGTGGGKRIGEEFEP